MSYQSSSDKDHKARMEEYWNKNLQVIAICLAIWALVSYGFGILFVEALNNIWIGGVPLGFWFSQQGSIYVFIVLIFVYGRVMDKLDKEYGVQE